MSLRWLEAGPAAHRADFWAYGAAVALLALALLVAAPQARWPWLTACVVAGAAAWSLAEYVLHRLVLHRLHPFHRWHGEHHVRPSALIGTPTAISATLFATLVLAPAWLLAGAWPACAFTLGMLAGYLAYVVTHDATHHAAPPGLAGSSWLRNRRRWHARHHRRNAAPACYGVTSGFWDRVFGTGVALSASRGAQGRAPKQ